MVAECHRDGKKRRKPFTPKDFIPPHLLLDTPSAPGPQKLDAPTRSLRLALALGAPPEIVKQLRAQLPKPKKLRA